MEERKVKEGVRQSKRHTQECSQQTERNYYSSLFSTGDDTCGILHRIFGSLIQEGFADMGEVRQRATQIVKSLDHMSYMRQGEGAGVD